jgi:hypothetical protein
MSLDAAPLRPNFFGWRAHRTFRALAGRKRRVNGGAVAHPLREGLPANRLKSRRLGI